jgi:hypothetical protein
MVSDVDADLSCLGFHHLSFDADVVTEVILVEEVVVVEFFGLEVELHCFSVVFDVDEGDLPEVSFELDAAGSPVRVTTPCVIV